MTALTYCQQCMHASCFHQGFVHNSNFQRQLLPQLQGIVGHGLRCYHVTGVIHQITCIAHCFRRDFCSVNDFRRLRHSAQHGSLAQRCLLCFTLEAVEGVRAEVQAFDERLQVFAAFGVQQDRRSQYSLLRLSLVQSARSSAGCLTEIVRLTVLALATACQKQCQQPFTLRQHQGGNAACIINIIVLRGIRHCCLGCCLRQLQLVDSRRAFLAQKEDNTVRVIISCSVELRCGTLKLV